MSKKWISIFVIIMSVCFIFSLIAPVDAARKSKKGQNEVEEQSKQWEELSPTKIEEDYKNIKGGWKYLKWGMSIDETKCLFKYYNKDDDQLYIESDQGDVSPDNGKKEKETMWYGNNQSVTSRLIVPLIGLDRYYFFRGKLMAVTISLSGYSDADFAVVIKTLKEKFPKGKVSNGKFSYYSPYLIIVTLQSSSSWGLGFVDPNAVKEIQHLNKLEENAEKEGRENEIKGKF